MKQARNSPQDKKLTALQNGLLQAVAAGKDPRVGLPYSKLGQLQSMVNRKLLIYTDKGYTITPKGQARLEEIEQCGS